MNALSVPDLMHHQHEGIEFLIKSSGALLAFEQGLGKTRVVLEAFRRVLQNGSARRLLVICPNSLKRNWIAEISRYTPELDAEIVGGAARDRRRLFAEVAARVVITSYETARTEITAILALLQRQPTAMVLDESHAAKNWRSLTSTAARHFAPHCAYRWLLSGTPVPNSPADLYTQIEILAPKARPLGSLERFLAEADAHPDLGFARDQLSDLVLRRTKEQCLDLPEKTFIDIQVELPAWQRRLYDEMRSEMVCAVRAMSGEEYAAFASTALVQLTRLIQIATNPRLLLPKIDDVPGKFAAIDDLLEDIFSIAARKVILWSSYIGTIEALLERYAQYGAVALYGGTPAEDRQTIAQKFQKDPAVRLLIANPAAAGTGFTLTAASFTVYESLSWRYDFYAQSQDRNHRIGQTVPVTYVRFIATDTIEEAIIKALERKSVMAANLLGDDRRVAPLAALSRDEMCRLLLTNELPNG
jgi:SNF2 family DNA or RNA helicase